MEEPPPEEEDPALELALRALSGRLAGTPDGPEGPRRGPAGGAPAAPPEERARRLLVRRSTRLRALVHLRPHLDLLFEDLVRRRLAARAPVDCTDARLVCTLALALAGPGPPRSPLLRHLEALRDLPAGPFGDLGDREQSDDTQVLGCGERAGPLEAAAAAHALLRAAPRAVPAGWDWAAAFDLLRHRSGDVRWHACRVLRLRLALPAAAFRRLEAAALAPHEARMCAMRAALFTRQLFDDGVGEEGDQDGGDGGKGGEERPDPPVGAAALLARLGGGAPRPPPPGETPLTPTTFVPHASIARAVRLGALGLLQGDPVLVAGPPGSGKTALAEHLAAAAGRAGDVVVLHMDDHVDAKALVGSYVCGRAPGEYVWRNGPLAHAVECGKWLLLEDVDVAPPDVLALLEPVVRDGRLPVPGRSRTLRARPGFQVLATVATPAADVATPQEHHERIRDALANARVSDAVKAAWTLVPVPAPGPADVRRVLAARHPELAPVAPLALATLEAMQRVAGQVGPDAPSAAPPFLRETVRQAAAHRAATSRAFSLRDLLKWAGRMSALHGQHLEHLARLREPGGPQGGQQEVLFATANDVLQVPEGARALAFKEAVDVFAMGFARRPERDAAVAVLAAIWKVFEDPPGAYLATHVPDVRETPAEYAVGRAALRRAAEPQDAAAESAGPQTPDFALTGSALRLMEQVAVAVRMQEPVLLVGETGVGKTSAVQQLSRACGAPLSVVNLSNQTDSADLLGGFKPVEPQVKVRALVARLGPLMQQTWPKGDNSKFVQSLLRLAAHKKWGKVIKGVKLAIAKAQGTAFFREEEEGAGRAAEAGSEALESFSNARNGPKNHRDNVRAQWGAVEKELADVEQWVRANSTFVFTYVDGALTEAVKEGHWVLLDEINLAPAEALERLAGLLDSRSGSVVLTEKGDIEPIARHPGFRLFAAMNPATDAGKSDLPAALRNRFTELFVPDSLDRPDLELVVRQALKPATPHPPVEAVVDFYLDARHLALGQLSDISNQNPCFSLRSLARMLRYVRRMAPVYGLQRSLLDGAALAFLTLLDEESRAVMRGRIRSHLLPGGSDADLRAVLRAAPRGPTGHLPFDAFWVEAGPLEVRDEADPEVRRFILTPAVEARLRDLARAVAFHAVPVLLQGPTSSGKTSMVHYLAKRTGHKCIRINNHEHTDVQEYLGSYVASEDGKLRFQEGALVQALRAGHWVILDELNLAPTEVLEALNRLLDDNHELYVPELNEVVRPHPRFMLFATQNPGTYGGRKTLSRALRNRFAEIFIDDVPPDEVTTMVEKRCALPHSFATKMVGVMQILQRSRKKSDVFSGKKGLITTRDLFRWASRPTGTYQELAENGYLLLGERLRSAEERALVQRTLESVLRVRLDMGAVYDAEARAAGRRIEELRRRPAGGGGTLTATTPSSTIFSGILWGATMRKLFTLATRCAANREPCLLIGETGCGKTTVVQMLAGLHERRLRIINCHQHTEASDFLGGYRPSRNLPKAIGRAVGAATALLSNAALCSAASAACVGLLREVFGCGSGDLGALDVARLIERACRELRGLEEALLPPSTQQAAASLETQSLARCVAEARGDLADAARIAALPFEWADGPLVEAMKQGDVLLIDEINLAEDAVLERLNSVFETERTLTLTEKGGADIAELVAHPDFLVFATMNPGLDFGKRELSPALRSRFTENWIENDLGNAEELRALVDLRLRPDVGAAERRLVREALVGFWQRYRAATGKGAPSGKGPQRPAQSSALGRLAASTSTRDLLAWVGFINETFPAAVPSAADAIAHGAFLTLIDALGVGADLTTSPEGPVPQFQRRCAGHLAELLGKTPAALRETVECSREGFQTRAGGAKDGANGAWGLAPFFLPLGDRAAAPPHVGEAFAMDAPSVRKSVLKILRAAQLRRAVLLEGSPGVGKSSVVLALAARCRQKVVRINLSEQTDLADLMGTDLPCEDLGTFAWSDGPLLQAIQEGSWVLLDELNLASQSVLEGLNSLLDHRSEVFVPELGRVFRCPPTFQLFATQNPLSEGSGRKGLPQSFLNRFTRVKVDPLTREDLLFIALRQHGSLDRDCVEKMIRLNELLHRRTMVDCTLGQEGWPWDFNLRDVLRWCQLVAAASSSPALSSSAPAVVHAFDAVYRQRLRSLADRAKADAAYAEVFGAPPLAPAFAPSVAVAAAGVTIGSASIPAAQAGGGDGAAGVFKVPHGQRRALQAAGLAVEHGWPCCVIGELGAGAERLVTSLAALCDQDLGTVTATDATDGTDLLGSFEQYDRGQWVATLVGRVERALRDHSRRVLAGDNADGGAALARLRDLHRTWQGLAAAGEGGAGLDGPVAEARLDRLIDFVGELAAEAPSAELGELLRLLRAEKHGAAGTQRGKVITWIDGPLVRAVKTGRWLLITNANLCNPAILDRLNPLMEPGGKLMVNEAGGGNGGIAVLEPHRDFRLFLAYNPVHGEISRAMRNRCVEVFLARPPSISRDLFQLMAPDRRTPVQLAEALLPAFVAGNGGLSGSALVGEAVRKTVQHLLCGGFSFAGAVAAATEFARSTRLSPESALDGGPAPWPPERVWDPAPGPRFDVDAAFLRGRNAWSAGANVGIDDDAPDDDPLRVGLQLWGNAGLPPCRCWHDLAFNACALAALPGRPGGAAAAADDPGRLWLALAKNAERSAADGDLATLQALVAVNSAGTQPAVVTHFLRAVRAVAAALPPASSVRTALGKHELALWSLRDLYSDTYALKPDAVRYHAFRILELVRGGDGAEPQAAGAVPAEAVDRCCGLARSLLEEDADSFELVESRVLPALAAQGAADKSLLFIATVLQAAAGTPAAARAAVDVLVLVEAARAARAASAELAPGWQDFLRLVGEALRALVDDKCDEGPRDNNAVEAVTFKDSWYRCTRLVGVDAAAAALDFRAALRDAAVSALQARFVAETDTESGALAGHAIRELARLGAVPLQTCAIHRPSRDLAAAFAATAMFHRSCGNLAGGGEDGGGADGRTNGPPAAEKPLRVTLSSAAAHFAGMRSRVGLTLASCPPAVRSAGALAPERRVLALSLADLLALHAGPGGAGLVRIVVDGLDHAAGASAAPPPAVEAAPEPSADWAKKTVRVLQAELKRRGLPAKGRKAELVAALEAHCAAAAKPCIDDDDADDDGGGPRRAYAEAKAKWRAAAAAKAAALFDQSLFSDLLDRVVLRPAAAAGSPPDGACWVLLGLARLHLAAPAGAYDYALTGTIEADAARLELEVALKPRLRAGHRALCDAGAPTAHVQGLVRRLEASVAGLAGEPRPRHGPVRPLASQYAALKRHVRAFLSNALAISRVRRLCEGGPASGRDEEARALALVVTSWIEKLAVDFVGYGEIVDALALGCLEVVHGLGAISRAGGDTLAEGPESAFPLVGNPCAPVGEAAAHLGASAMLLAPRPAARELSEVERAARYALPEVPRVLAAAERMAVAARLSGRWDASQRAFISDILHGLSLHWSAVKKREEEAAEEAAAAYKYKAAEHRESLLTDEAIDAWFVEDGGNDGSGEGAPCTGGRPGSTQTDASTQDLEARFGTAAVAIHADYYTALWTLVSGGERAEPPSLKRILDGAYRFCRTGGLGRGGEHLGVLVPLIDCQIVAGKLDHKLDVPDVMGTDIRRPCAAEALRLRAPIRELIRQVDAKLEVLEGHPLLQALRDSGVYVLEMDLATPLKKYMAALEVLLERAKTWKDSAPGDDSFRVLVGLMEISDQWKRLEVTAWARALDYCARTHVAEAEKSWFYLDRLLDLHADGSIRDSALKEAGKAIEAYLSSSPAGQYAVRLGIVRAFRCQIEVEAMHSGGVPVVKKNLKKLAAMLYNLHCHYASLLAPVERAIGLELQPLEVELKKMAKASNWEKPESLTGIEAARMKRINEKTLSARYRLRSLVRQYDKFLCRSARNVVEEKQSAAFSRLRLADIDSFPPDGQGSCFESWLEHWNVSKDALADRSAVPEQSLRACYDAAASPQLRDAGLRKLAERLHAVIFSAETLGAGRDAFHAIGSCSAEIDECLGNIVEAVDLKAEEKAKPEAGEADEDGEADEAEEDKREAQKAKRAQYLRVRKGQLADILRLLKKLGLPKRVPDIDKYQGANNAWISAPAPLSTAKVLRRYRARAEEQREVERCYHGCTALTQDLIANFTALHKDLSAQDAETGLAACLFLQQLQRKQKQTLETASAQHRILLQCIELLQDCAADAPVLPLQRPARAWLWKIKAVNDSLLEAALQAQALLAQLRGANIASTPASDGAALAVQRLVGALKEAQGLVDGILLPSPQEDDALHVLAGYCGARAERERAWPLLVSRDHVRRALAVFDLWRSARDVLFQNLVAARELDLFHGLHAALQEGCCMRAEFCADLRPPAVPAAAPAPAAGYAGVAEDVSRALEWTLVWSQTFRTEPPGPEHGVAPPTFQEVHDAAARRLNVPALKALQKALGSLLRRLAAASDAAPQGAVAGDGGRLGGLLATLVHFLRTAAAGHAQAVLHAAGQYKTLTLFTHATASYFLNLYAKGFNVPELEREEKTIWEVGEGGGHGAGQDMDGQVEEAPPNEEETPFDPDLPLDDLPEDAQKEEDAEDQPAHDTAQDLRGAAEELRGEDEIDDFGEAGHLDLEDGAQSVEDPQDAADPQLDLDQWDLQDEAGQHGADGVPEKPEDRDEGRDAEDGEKDGEKEPAGLQEGEAEPVAHEDPMDTPIQDADEEIQGDVEMDPDKMHFEGGAEDEEGADDMNVDFQDSKLDDGEGEGGDEPPAAEDDDGRDGTPLAEADAEDAHADGRDGAPEAENVPEAEGPGDGDAEEDGGEEEPGRDLTAEAEAADEEMGDAPGAEEEEGVEAEDREVVPTGGDAPGSEAEEEAEPEAEAAAPGAEREEKAAACPAEPKPPPPAEEAEKPADEMAAGAPPPEPRDASAMLEMSTMPLQACEEGAREEEPEAAPAQTAMELEDGRDANTAAAPAPEAAAPSPSQANPAAAGDGAAQDEPDEPAAAARSAPEEEAGRREERPEEHGAGARREEEAEEEDDDAAPEAMDLETPPEDGGEGREVAHTETLDHQATDAMESDDAPRPQDRKTEAAAEAEPPPRADDRADEPGDPAAPEDSGELAATIVRVEDIELDPPRREADRAAAPPADLRAPKAATAEGAQLWQQSVTNVADTVGELVQQLRLLLLPTEHTKLGGEFRTGKRINMRKVIPYIASQFRKDKIWMRRNKPHHRKYQITLAVDDSRSMRENRCTAVALDALALLCKAMMQLEAGELGVLSFGGERGVKELHALGQHMSDQVGAHLCSALSFAQDSSVSSKPVAQLLRTLGPLLDRSARSNRAHKDLQLQQLVLVIADGRINEKEEVKRLVRELSQRHGLLVAFIALDNQENSLLEMQSIQFEGGKPVFHQYLDSFPFPYYVLLREVDQLPQTLCDLLKQWFELTAAGA